MEVVVGVGMVAHLLLLSLVGGGYQVLGGQVFLVFVRGGYVVCQGLGAGDDGLGG